MKLIQELNNLTFYDILLVMNTQILSVTFLL